MVNHVENLWDALRKGTFPSSGDDELKKLKVAFLQGVHCGRELVVQSSSLPDREMVTFNADIRHQVEGSLSNLGHRPGRIDVGINRIITQENGK